MSTYFAKNLYFFAKLFFLRKNPCRFEFFPAVEPCGCAALAFFYLHSHFPGVQYQAGDECGTNESSDSRKIMEKNAKY